MGIRPVRSWWSGLAGRLGLAAALPFVAMSGAVAAELQTTAGIVAAVDEQGISLKAASGKEEKFLFPTEENSGKELPKEERNRICNTFKWGLFPGLPATVKWAKDRVIKGLESEGVITGIVVGGRSKQVLKIRVEGIKQPVSMISRGPWSNPDPADVNRFATVNTGALVEVSFVLKGSVLRLEVLKILKQGDGEPGPRADAPAGEKPSERPVEKPPAQPEVPGEIGRAHV
jgi:hypothetical protein